MVQQLYEMMKRASIFVILAQTIIHFGPRGSYEKYLKLLVSLMTITVLVFPVLELIKGDIYTRFQTELNEYEIQMEQLMKKVPSCDILDESAYLSTIVDEIKNKINKMSDKTGYVVETLEIQGISKKESYLENTSKTVKIVVVPRNTAVSTIRVDKVKCSENEDKSTRNWENMEIASKLCQIYAAELGMEENELEVIVNGAEK